MKKQWIEFGGVSPQLGGRGWESDTIPRIGRLDTLEVFLDDPSISRRHAEILATDQGWMVHDLGSTNGTYLNGMRLGRTDRRLRREDVLQCGKLYFVITELIAVVRPRAKAPPAHIRVEAAARQSWDQACSALVVAGDGRPAQAECLLRLLQSGYHFCHAATLTELLLSILEDTVTALEARGGVVVLADGLGDEPDLTGAVAVPERQAGTVVRFSKTLAQRAFDCGESLLGRDVVAAPN